MGTFTSAMGALLYWCSKRSRTADVRRLNVFQRLQHLGNEVFADLDQAGMLGLLQRVDQLSIGTLQVAFDHVVLEVVDGPRLVLHVVVAPAACRRCCLGEHATAGHSHESEESNSDDE